MKESKDLLLDAVNASLRAGEKILDVYNSEDYEVQFKEDRSPLTLADRKADNLINEMLSVSGIPYFSEEGIKTPFEERTGWERYWLVDPLDGTKEFIKRNGEFTVNIALIENQIPVTGVVFVPVLKQLYFAEKKTGSYKIENVLEKEIFPSFDKLMVRAKKIKSNRVVEKFRIVGSRSHLSPETNDYFKKLQQQYGEAEIVTKGSSLKICLVAEGKADIYPRLGPTMEWDTAAGHAIALYAGCSVLQFDSGDPLIYNKPDLLNPWFVVRSYAFR
ncbi:MAG: 3'(2'),5'-bisphosphate nucleotidase CysQ [Bacteroidales bacterium]|nr:3'(2'),5'-bisphosphate nucleotidase CysQ [Bacteroidales bacterium]